MLYIKFSENKPLKRKVKGIKKTLKFIAELVIPKANPDFENKITSVNSWLLEFLDKDSIPYREIGLGNNDEVLLKLPYKKNYGYWIDSDLTYYDFEKLFNIEYITPEYFEEKWDKM